MWYRLTPLRTLPRITKRHYQRFSRARSYRVIHDRLEDIEAVHFREACFMREQPALITPRATFQLLPPELAINCAIPAALKWFENGSSGVQPSQAYLSPFGDTMLPYELITDNPQSNPDANTSSKIFPPLTAEFQSIEMTPGAAFSRFDAPLSLFLKAYESGSKERLYIAQAQLTSLPKQLQADLPVPRLVMESGKGDIYDANLWMGIPPTDTPLHRDPNPNMFVQLASCKRVKLFPPVTGDSIFEQVQKQIGKSSSPNIRGEEMMDGPEREMLEKEVWGQNDRGFEILVGPGDAVFIPKGWWHSIKSIGTGVNASVNWWFR